VLCLGPAETKLCFPCHSPTLRPWIAVCRSRVWQAGAVLRGGALEPEPRSSPENAHPKSTRVFQRCTMHSPSRVFLSQAGPRFDLALVQAEHHLLCTCYGNKKGDRWSPSPARNVASTLALTPRREDGDVTAIAPRLRLEHAR
jgi:hypothetical protein